MSPQSATSVLPSDIETYETDGAVCLRSVIDPQWLATMADGIDDIVAQPTPLHTIQTLEGDQGFFLSDICMAQQSRELQDFVLNGPTGVLAAHIMKSERINFWADTLWVKHADTPKRTRWHQDQPFFWVNGRQMCVIWCPLNTVPESDSLELIKGSHRWRKWFAPELSRFGQDLYETGGNTFARMPDIDSTRDAYEIIRWGMEPGDVIVFNGSTVHGAPGNSSGRSRRAISTIWMGDDTKYGKRPNPGRPHFHGIDLSPGDAMDSSYFPRVWPRESGQPLAPDTYARFTDPALNITN